MADHQVTIDADKLWQAIGASLSMIIGLIAVIYHRINSDIKANTSSLERGQVIFSEIGNKLVELGIKIQSLQEAETFDMGEIDRLELDIKQLHSRLLVIETEHKSCYDYVQKMKQIVVPPQGR